MSIIGNTTQAPAPVTMPASVRKAFKASNLPALVSGKLAKFASDEPVKPSAVAMDKATMQAALGGKASPASFASGLIFAVAAHAWGQGKLASLQEGLPKFAQSALVKACEHVKCGGGITASTLSHAVMHALDYVMTLESAKRAAPLPVADVEEVETIDAAPVVDAAPAPVAEPAQPFTLDDAAALIEAAIVAGVDCQAVLAKLADVAGYRLSKKPALKKVA